MLGLWAAAGAAVGLTATLLVAVLWPDAEPSEVEASTTTTLLPIWYEEQEVPLGPAVLVPEAFRLTHSGVKLKYRLEPITPASHGPGDVVETAVFPDWWTLFTENGPVAGRSMPWTREVVFDVPADLNADQIRGVRLDTTWLLAPLRVPFTPEAGDRSRHEVAPGVTAEIALVQDQAEGALVVVDLLSADPFTAADLTVQGSGAGWRPATASVSGATRWSLLYLRGELPDPIPMEVSGTAWMPQTRSIMLDLEGIPRGS
jgi:hypothetical protein